MSKKFLFICFLLGMFMFMPAGAHAASDDGSPATITGDVNGDGVLDVTDVMVLANYISNPTAQTLNKDVADINGDGTVNSSDIDALINKVLGIVTKYYWYVGQTNPSTMTESDILNNIVSDTSSSGWRELGSTLPNSLEYRITDGTKGKVWYEAIPVDANLVAGSSSDPDTSVDKGDIITIGNVKYQIWINNGATSNRHSLTYNK